MLCKRCDGVHYDSLFCLEISFFLVIANTTCPLDVQSDSVLNENTGTPFTERFENIGNTSSRFTCILSELYSRHVSGVTSRICFRLSRKKGNGLSCQSKKVRTLQIRWARHIIEPYKIGVWIFATILQGCQLSKTWTLRGRFESVSCISCAQAIHQSPGTFSLPGTSKKIGNVTLKHSLLLHFLIKTKAKLNHWFPPARNWWCNGTELGVYLRRFVYVLSRVEFVNMTETNSIRCFFYCALHSPKL